MASGDEMTATLIGAMDVKPGHVVRVSDRNDELKTMVVKTVKRLGGHDIEIHFTQSFSGEFGDFYCCSNSNPIEVLA